MDVEVALPEDEWRFSASLKETSKVSYVTFYNKHIGLEKDDGWTWLSCLLHHKGSHLVIKGTFCNHHLLVLRYLGLRGVSSYMRIPTSQQQQTISGIIHIYPVD
jgi:hypothetical protein